MAGTHKKMTLIHLPTHSLLELRIYSIQVVPLLLVERLTFLSKRLKVGITGMPQTPFFKDLLSEALLLLSPTEGVFLR